MAIGILIPLIVASVAPTTGMVLKKNEIKDESEITSSLNPEETTYYKNTFGKNNLYYMGTWNEKEPIHFMQNSKSCDSTIAPLSNGGEFHGNCSNESIYVITISSENEINFNNISFKFDYNIKDEQTIGGAFFDGCYYTDGTELNILMTNYLSENFSLGNLRYLQYKLGNRDYLYENRSLYSLNGDFTSSEYHYSTLSLSPGKWHFVFAGGLFDLNEEDVLINISVWMNFSNPIQELNITTNTEGKVYALWYGEFDTNLLISKAHVFEMMLGGKAIFHINNTFIYDFGLYPSCQGFWRIKWTTPEGTDRFNMLLLRNREIYNSFKTNNCISGVGPSGDYTLTTSYFDRVPILLRDMLDWPYATPIFFVGLDVNLP